MLVTGKNFFGGKIAEQKARLKEMMDGLRAIGAMSENVIKLEDEIKRCILMSGSFLDMKGYMDNDLKRNDENINSLLAELENILISARVAQAKSIQSGQ